jgi:probable addiction module antidote protein
MNETETKRADTNMTGTIRTKTRPFDAANYLNDEADIAAYLQVAMEDGDPALLAAALDDVSRARGRIHAARDV